MHIIELPKGGKICIKVSVANKCLEFNSEVIYTNNESILVLPIQDSSGNAISLVSNEVNVSLEYVESDKMPIVWESVTLRYCKYKGSYYHQIWQESDGIPMNRREAFRVHIGESARLKLIVSGEIINVVFKDISSTGFSFISSKDINIDFTKVCKLESVVDSKKLNLDGMIVRKQPIEGTNKFVYGCALYGKSKELDYFVMQKQRENLSRKNNK